MSRAVLLLSIVGCSEYNIDRKPDGSGASGGSALRVSPSELDFGAWEPGSLPDALSVTIENVGDRSLDIVGAQFFDATASFSLISGGPGALDPGEEVTWSLSYTPELPAGPTEGELVVISTAETNAEASVTLLGEALGDETNPLAQIQVTPPDYSFGELVVGGAAEVDVVLENVGGDLLTVYSLQYLSAGTALALTSPPSGLPWTLAPEEKRAVSVSFTPEDESLQVGTLSVISSDPSSPTVEAYQDGWGVSAEAQCYILDDGTAHETTSSSTHVVDHHGDTDLYWYEPSGQHGLLGSADPEDDFQRMHDYVTTQSTSSAVSWPLSFSSNSTLSTFDAATFTYVLCDFWVAEEDSAADYALSIGAVDDGVQIIVNGQIVDYLKLGESGTWTLTNIYPGQVNSVLITLVDDSAVNRYMNDMILLYQGVPF